jgi:pSer/pThr/pTyr-binding forkhead associated (FHA) protein
MMIMSGPDDGQRIYLNQAHGDGQTDGAGAWLLVLGRAEECDISIPFDTQVSRRHAILCVSPDGRFWLSDAESTNGTFVAKTQIKAPTEVERGQLFRLGRTWLRIQPEGDE